MIIKALLPNVEYRIFDNSANVLYYVENNLLDDIKYFKHKNQLGWEYQKDLMDELGLIRIAVEFNHLKLVKWLYKEEIRNGLGIQMCISAIQNGNLEMLEWIIGKGYPYDDTELYVEAIIDDQIEIARWLRFNNIWFNPENIIISIYRKKKYSDRYRQIVEYLKGPFI
jgi:hypothetical protein